MKTVVYISGYAAVLLQKCILVLQSMAHQLVSVSNYNGGITAVYNTYE